ncbi:Maf family protein [Candidatus Phytoplasma meliae]|uniref:Nucleoside triphosphate pyrophosphatase n=1 Tax=Candidatus Phytoplasma meliae TaxID=1848402 RepID=A0ABS5CYG3_9MOLU|nr:nucleoside triphosphate pyrophosphatase [Candidatus Phytoplasma meliae]MBP5836006.1 septum formation protein Maf [Candidatus Phytoplasma meliae]
MHIILASQSPSRLHILQKMKLMVQVKPANIDETPLPHEKPDQLALRLALTKAKKIAAMEENGFIIGADTVSVCEEEILPKAVDNDKIRYCLHKCSGKIRKEMTGVCVIKKHYHKMMIEQNVIISEIYFNKLSEQEIEFYVNAQEALNTAGGFKIEGIGEIFIQKIKGNPSSISGLPMSIIYQMLTKLGYPFFDIKKNNHIIKRLNHLKTV